MQCVVWLQGGGHVGRDFTKGPPDAVLVQGIARAHRWLELLKAGTAQSVTEIARRERLTETYVSRVLRLAFLAPVTVESVLAGHGALRSTTADLLLRQDIHPAWARQVGL